MPGRPRSCRGSRDRTGPGLLQGSRSRHGYLTSGAHIRLDHQVDLECPATGRHEPDGDVAALAGLESVSTGAAIDGEGGAVAAREPHRPDHDGSCHGIGQRHEALTRSPGIEAQPRGRYPHAPYWRIRVGLVLEPQPRRSHDDCENPDGQDEGHNHSAGEQDAYPRRSPALVDSHTGRLPPRFSSTPGDRVGIHEKTRSRTDHAIRGCAGAAAGVRFCHGDRPGLEEHQGGRARDGA